MAARWLPRRQFRRRVQQSVDPKPDSGTRAVCFQVNVARAPVDGIQQEVIHDLHDRGRARLFFQVLQTVSLVAASRPLKAFEELREFAAVRVEHALYDGRARRGHRLHVTPGLKAKVADGVRVEGIGHRDGEASSLDGKGKDGLAARHRRLHAGQRVRIRPERRRHEAEVEHRRQRLGHLRLVHDAPAQENLVQPSAGAVPVLFGIAEHRGGQRPPFQEDSAKQRVVCGHRAPKVARTPGRLHGWMGRSYRWSYSRSYSRNYRTGTLGRRSMVTSASTWPMSARSFRASRRRGSILR